MSTEKLSKTPTLPDRLRAAMNAAGLRQRDLVERVGVSAGYLSYVLSGKRHPSRRVLRDLAAALDCSPTWLETGQGSMRADGPATVNERPATHAPGGTLTAAMESCFMGTPLDTAVHHHRMDIGGRWARTLRAWRDLNEEQQQAVTAELRRVAALAVVAERTLPEPIAEKVNELLRAEVHEYLETAVTRP